MKVIPSHFGKRLDDESYIPHDAIHTFLIRHPIKVLKSYLATGEKTKGLYFAGMLKKLSQNSSIYSEAKSNQMKIKLCQNYYFLI